MSAANFAPYQPPPDERQRALAASAARASTPSSAAARSPLYASSSRSSGGGAAGGAAIPPGPAASPAPARRDTGDAEKQPMLGGAADYRRDSYEDEYDARYATESYQSSRPQQEAGRREAMAQHNGVPVWAQSQGQRAAYLPASTAGGAAADQLSYSTAANWNLSNLCFAAWSLPPFSSVMILIYETQNDLVRFQAYQAGMLGIGGVTLLWILRAWFGWKSFSIVVGMALLGYSWVCGSAAANAAPTLTHSPYLPVFGPLAEQWVGDE